MGFKKIENKTGVAVPLAALRTEDSPVVGEFSALIDFADFSSKAGLSIIQLLPVLDTGTHSSPYSSLSALALHPIYIRLSELDEFKKCYEKDPVFKKTYVEFLKHKTDIRFDYDFVVRTKDFLLRRIWKTVLFSGGKKIIDSKNDFYQFIKDNEDWLPFYCVFKHLKFKFMQRSWHEWEERFQKMSEEQILAMWNDETLHADIYFYVWEQLEAHRQLKKASDHVKKLGIILKGDLPILLNEDSCDVWAFSDVFKENFRGGSPPDADNPTGQHWGFPCYDFASQKKNDFAWWRRRIRLASQYFGAYRLDHIPGFFRLWSIPDGELTAEMGHTEPFAAITESQLMKAGFSKERIRWLSQPHIPTEDFIRLIGDAEATREILGMLCNKIGHEELWLFKPSIKSESDLKKISLDKYNIDASIQLGILRRLGDWWKNRTLIEVSKGKFVRLWKYGETRAWNSLSDAEKSALGRLFAESDANQEKIWKKQAERIFTALTDESDMIPCGENLGIFIPCMEDVLNKFNILELKVFRWCTERRAGHELYTDIRSYRRLSVATTSVHDSSTVREFYDTNIKKFLSESSLPPSMIFFAEPTDDNPAYSKRIELPPVFDAKAAQTILETYAETSSAWFINPLQDWLYLDQKYYAFDSRTERINIPGTVSKFNWTWRMCTTVEKLSANERLVAKIKRIADIHNANS